MHDVHVWFSPSLYSFGGFLANSGFLTVSLPQELGRFLNTYIETGSRPCQFWSELFVDRFVGVVN